jgi:hypothetical protein
LFFSNWCAGRRKSASVAQADCEPVPNVRIPIKNMATPGSS